MSNTNTPPNSITLENVIKGLNRAYELLQGAREGNMPMKTAVNGISITPRSMSYDEVLDFVGEQLLTAQMDIDEIQQKMTALLTLPPAEAVND